MINKQTLLYDLFQSYYDARKNKRNKQTQLEFELQLETNLIQLAEELLNETYQVGKSIYFIQNHPVKREIFAGNFRDRIIHHLIYNYLSPIYEKQFIYDSYSCRIGRGTSLGIKRLQKSIRSCSHNYTKDCYILKLDISGYFMGINKQTLYTKIQNTLSTKKQQLTTNYDFLINLIKQVIFNDCTKNSHFKGKKEDYIGLPKNKSLFFAKPGYGLPIGNLTSQLFSNIYMADFDTHIKKELNTQHYGRYVDDFYIVHEDKKYLSSLIGKVNSYLETHLELTLHPKKIYLQHYTKGVLFLGTLIKPYRTYLRKRTIGYFYEKIRSLNNQLKANNNKLTPQIQQDFHSTINSYLGMLKHHKSYKIRKKILLNQVSPYFWNHFYISNHYTLIKLKNGTLGKPTGLQNQLGPFNTHL